MSSSKWVGEPSHFVNFHSAQQLSKNEILVHNHLLLLASKADDVVAGVVEPLAVVLHLDELAGAHHGEVGEDGHVREVADLQVGELTVLQDGYRWGSWKGLGR